MKTTLDVQYVSDPPDDEVLEENLKNRIRYC
jgi:hypothetical protein